MTRKTILLENPLPDQKEWKFNVPQDRLEIRNPGKPSGKIFGKRITFTATAITLEIAELPNNRILQDDDPSKFIAVSFGGLRFPDTFLRVTGEYVQRLMEAGLHLNGVQYRFYHHSNSQLRERSCFMRVANSDAELDTRIYALGEFKKINNIAKRAKRIGLLFSGASLDFKLDPQLTLDISDITVGETVFSDGCGLMARKFAIQVAKAKGIIFRNKRYTPTVFQIRYLGYKGVLMLHPQLEEVHLVHFRRSMKKFNTNTKNTFSVVDYSTPYAFGRLNNDIIVLLSSLGVTNDKLLAKQEEYFKWIEDAAMQPLRAIDFLSCLGKYEEAERVLLDGLDDPKVFERVQSAQKSEIAKFRKGESEKIRTRMIIHKSRLLYGVCDPYGVLKEGQVHVRITTENGAQTLINASVLVVRNPCLHPGDCLKLRAVHNPSLEHLIDCIVFAGVARPDHPPAPSMSSGGDLDGDRYFVCWDPDIVPPTVVESYNYPPNKERVKKDITRKDLATHFAMYNNSGLARVASLHQKWLRCKPEGALSTECQELNALHSQSVDGARIKIPDRLSSPPETKEPFILDLLAEAAETFSKRFCESLPVYDMGRDLSKEDAMLYIRQLFRGERRAISEFEMFNMAVVIARKREIDLRTMLPHLDFGALTAEQKHVVSSTLGLTPEEDRYVWNSLFWSDILTDQDLEQRNLKARIPLQRFYSSKKSGLQSFWQYLKMCLHDFTRKVLILKVDNRFGIGIFIRGEVPWDEESPVNDNRHIVVCSFMPSNSGPMSTYRPCSNHYRLYVGDNAVQLFAKQRGDTFVFINRPPEASGNNVITSIALQKISVPVQRQIGRVNRSPVTGIELHVISNRDRVAHQLFDLYFEHVATEAYISRLAQQKLPFTLNNLEDVDWNEDDRMWIKKLFIPKASQENFQSVLMNKEVKDIEKVLALALDHHASYELFWAFYTIVTPIERMNVNVTRQWIEKHPPLVYRLLKAYPPADGFVSPYLVDLELTIIQSIIKSANQYGFASLVNLEKVSASVARVSMDDYLNLLMLASLSARPSSLIQEFLFVLHECRVDIISQSALMEYAHKQALGIAFDRSEEAADECPCNDQGHPKRVGGRGPPPIVSLFPVPDDPTQVIAHVRVDQLTPVRIHSHVRLQAVSDPEKGWTDGKAVVDAVVVMVKTGEMRLEPQYPLPPEFARMQWRMYHAGSVATAMAMMDAVRRLVSEGPGCCSFSNLIVGKRQSDTYFETEGNSDAGDDSNNLDRNEHGLNPNQVRAVKSSENPLALVWGPPGTGKTTVVVKILYGLVKALGEDEKILMTASTHNAVDNVLERFIKLNNENILSNDKILRVATDNSKVNKELQSFTIDARVGGDMNENNRLVKAALGRVKSARIVFTTCAGAGLGILRKFDFEIAIIDEASQVTEACALIPLVKGCRKAVLVGDHVQLRPMVRNMAKVLLHDVSMLERLYTGPNAQGMSKTMLNVQYRFPQRLAVFPSNEFYQGRLRTAMNDAPTRLSVLKGSKFPWPTENGEIIPVVFLQCGIEEEMTGMSKRNVGQAEVVQYVIKLLTTRDAPEEEPKDNSKGKGKEVDRTEFQKADGTSGSKKENGEKLEITVLTPYTRQVSALKDLVPKDVQVFTIDSFQGRECDIVIFSTVRCNVERDIGFVDDERRLNVMWTRAKLALIIVGDRTTLTAKVLWERALKSCIEVTLPDDPKVTISRAK